MAIVVKLREGMSIDHALSILKKKVKDSGNYKQLQRHREFEKPSATRRSERKLAKRRARRNARQQNLGLH